MTSFIKALSVDILAFFITETLGPTQVTSTNLARLLISSPVWKKEFMVKNPVIENEILFERRRTIFWK